MRHLQCELFPKDIYRYGRISKLQEALQLVDAEEAVKGFPYVRNLWRQCLGPQEIYESYEQ